LGAPNAGDLLSSLPDGVMPTCLAAVIVALLIVLPFAIRALRHSRKKFIVPVMMLLLTIPVLALAVNASQGAAADSILSLSQNNLDFNFNKNGQSQTKSATSRTTVNTDNATGYTLAAKLQSLSRDDIAVRLNEEPLAATAVDIYADDTGTSPNSYDHTLAITISGDIPTGVYQFDLVYELTENPPTVPTMQTFTASDCAALQPLEILVLRDIRNNQDYRVRKMQDDRCWMIDNLKLDSTSMIAARGSANLTNQDTNIPSDFGPVTLSAAVESGSSMSDVLQIWNPTPASAYCQGEIEDEYGDPFVGPLPIDSLTGCGYLYNFYTATAATFPTEDAEDGTAAPGDICPAGWRMPIIYPTGSPSDFAILNGWMAGDEAESFNGDSAHASGWQPEGTWQGALSGIAFSSSSFSQGMNGYYWSSQIFYGALDALSIVTSDSRVDFGLNSRASGLAVRCLAQ
jgi:hypothetical protein